MKRMLKIMGWTLFLSYVVICVLGLWMVDKLIFAPPPSFYRAEGPIQLIDDGDGGQLAIWQELNPEAAFTILYSHGNAEDLGEIAYVSEMFVAQGFSFVAYDYSGYGLSTGRASVQNSYQNIETVYGYLTEKMGVDASNIIVMGNSIGSGPSTYLAAKEPVGGLILQSAFTSIYRVVTQWPIFVGSPFPNLSRLRETDCPLLVIHGTADRVIPFAHGAELFDKAKEPKVFYPMPGVDHNEVLLFADEQYWAKVASFMALVPSP
ncbi:alpha/beta hydrolase [Kiritimatiellota bacterium B12222]|nr:alpha/beta hydrolase [Kiritimatiellota bacterium B12222]